jgi:hypothetical protein
MARKDTATDTTDQEIADLKGDPVATIDPDYSRTLGITDESPTLSDGHDEIVEEAPGLGPSADMLPPEGDPGDLSAFGRSPMLPDDLGLDDEGFGGPVDAGTDLGSTLLDDLAGDLSDPSGSSDGSGAPVFDDQSGWDRAGGDNGDDFDFTDDPLDTHTASDAWDTHTTLAEAAAAAYEGGDEALGDQVMGAVAEALAEAVAAAAAEAAGASGSDDDDDDDEEHESQYGDGDGSDDPPGSQTMPAPDDGTGGDPDADDFIGGRGDVDPPPETEDHGGGELIGGRGDVDPAPETEDQGGGGGLDMIALGLGAVDPLDGESTLLGGDEGNLAEMAAEADLGDVEIEFDDSLVDADIGEDV